MNMILSLLVPVTHVPRSYNPPYACLLLYKAVKPKIALLLCSVADMPANLGGGRFSPPSSIIAFSSPLPLCFFPANLSNKTPVLLSTYILFDLPAECCRSVRLPGQCPALSRDLSSQSRLLRCDLGRLSPSLCFSRR